MVSFFVLFGLPLADKRHRLVEIAAGDVDGFYGFRKTDSGHFAKGLDLFDGATGHDGASSRENDATVGARPAGVCPP